MAEATKPGLHGRGAREIDTAIGAGWIEVASPSKAELVSAFSDDLGVGEAEAIVLAVELKAVLLIDDLAGRRKARQLGVQITGTLGLLALAKNSGKISGVSSSIAKLQAGGYHLGRTLIEEFLIAMRESPLSEKEAGQ